MTFNKDIWYACWSILLLSRLSSKVKVIGQSSRSHEENDFLSATKAHYEMTYTSESQGGSTYTYTL